MARVYVGMSGGVDSSLTAALLVEQGHDVTGIYMKNWTEDLPGMRCPWAEDVADAKRVAVQLGIDFKVYDFQAEYKQYVVDYMLREYQAGNTPNPDIMCNQEVKFKLFLDAALADGAEMIATGHYARVEHAGDEPTDTDTSGSLVTPDGVDGGSSPEASVSAGSSALLRAIDANKDQTYFLYRVTAEALSKTLFPLGDYTKQEVRQMAADRGLYTADKSESMGVCFVGNVGIREFIGHYVQTEPGQIIDQTSGQVVGEHDGAIYYTIGQRHGLDVGGGLPYYVTGKDMATNIVYVSQNLNDEHLWRQELTLQQLHWIDQSPDGQRRYQVRLRHRGPLLDCQLEGDTVRLSEAVRSVASGQSAVIYDGEVCLGGGIVVS